MILAEPLALASGATLPNRIAKAAMSERLAERDGAPTESITRLYRRWGAGGVGMMLTGHVIIDARAVAESGNIVVEDDRHLTALRAWAAAGQAHGAKLWMQINHPGRLAPRRMGHEPVAPSAVPVAMSQRAAFAPPRALTDTEIHAIIDRFAASAAVAEAAGFAGVQIHAAHGYLLSQFLSPRVNLRDDGWGGDAVRRSRMLLSVVRAVRAAIGPKMGLAVKLNSADFQRGGFSRAESMDVVDALSAEGIDLLEVSGGTYEAAAMFTEPARSDRTAAREAYFLDYAAEVRARTALPLMVTGGFRSRLGMEQAIASGATDVVGMARPLILEPDLPKRLLNASAEAAYPVRLATGRKDLDALIQASWYQQQLQRMGSGLEPDPTLSRWPAAARMVLGMLPSWGGPATLTERSSAAATAAAPR